jgi:hypothetical protein
MEVNKYVSAADGDSPQQKIPQNGHHQVKDNLSLPLKSSWNFQKFSLLFAF